MCLILLAHDVHPAYRLIVAANRDEFHARPTAPAAFWTDAPELLAGRDLKEGGTWLGVSRTGRFSALTNYRDPAAQLAGAPSRGRLVADFLRSRDSAAAYVEGLRRTSAAYNAFNLLVADLSDLWYFGSRTREPRRLDAGVYGLSNHLLDTAWPKVERSKSALANLLHLEGDPLIDGLLAMLADRSRAEDDDLPQTGVSLEWERLLSSAFIVAPAYGTRSSTVVLWGRDGEVVFVERQYLPEGEPGGTVRQRLHIDPNQKADQCP